MQPRVTIRAILRLLLPGTLFLTQWHILAQSVVPQSSPVKLPEGWESWSPRSEIAPSFSVSPATGRTGSDTLKIETTDPSQFGAWKRSFLLDGPPRSYRFSAWYHAEHVSNELRSVITRLQWLDAKGRSERPPEYAVDVERQNGWKRVELFTETPTNARSLEIQLSLGFVDHGTVLWDNPQLEPGTSPRDRIIHVATVYCRPRDTHSAAESVERFFTLAEEKLRDQKHLDVLCLPEGISVVGNGKTYEEVSEALPGPTTDRLGKLARDLRSYVVAGIYERDGKIVYNTAVLIDRAGKLAGKYRKTHLPREEWEAGITPGNEYPIFQTDFGKIGLMTCWDVQFPEPCRAMALKGAELILLPIWGGSETLAKARAIENHLFLVSSSYDMKSFVVDPKGDVLAEATHEQPVAIAELHLDRKIYQPWLGDMKNRTWKERRPDIPVQ